MKKMNKQAADALLEDVILTEERLFHIAESLNYCADSDLRSLGYKKILLEKHRYLFIFRVYCDIAYVEAMYHELQDYENSFKTEALGR